MKKQYYPWIIVACCCGMATVALGLTVNCAGVFYAPMAQSLNVGIGDVSLYLTVMCISAAIFSPWAVKLTAKVKLQILIALGCFMATVAFFGISFANSLWQLYLWAVVIGISVAPLGMAMITSVIGNWFFRAMGLAIGISMSFSGIVGAVLSPVFSSLIEKYGWRFAFRAEALLVLAALIPAIVMIRMRPEELDMLPYGKMQKADSRRCEDAVDVKNGTTANGFGLLCVVSVMGSFIAGFGSHLSQHASSEGLPAMTGAYMISAAMIGNMSSKLGLGILCDAIGSKRACLLVFALTFAGLLGLLLLPSGAHILLLVSAFLLGMSYSCAGVGVSNLSKDVFGKKDFGRLYSYISSAGIVSSAFSYSLIGYSFDLMGSYTLAILVCIVMAIISAASVLTVFKKK